MNAFANPLCRLAPRMRLHSSVHSIHRGSKAAPAGLPKLRIEARLCSCSASPNTRAGDEATKHYLLKQKTAFNIHNPSLDHRVR